MDKQEQSVIDEFVNRHNGVNEFGAAYFEINGIEFTSEQFNQRAIELGWVSGYKWGVEYPTNGKKPDLPDDLMIIVGSRNPGYFYEARPVFCNDWVKCKLFKIVDERYKPKELELQTKHIKDLSDVIFAVSDAISVAIDVGAMPAARELQKINRDLLAKDPVVGIGQPELQTKPDNSWHERGERPPVGAECEVYNHAFGANAAWEKCTILWIGKTKCVYESDSCYERAVEISGPNYAEFRPIKTEREKFVDAALAIICESGVITKSGTLSNEIAVNLYDAGCRFVSQESSS